MKKGEGEISHETRQANNSTVARRLVGQTVGNLKNENTRNGGDGESGLRLPPLTRPGKGVYIDKYGMCKSRGERE